MKNKSSLYVDIQDLPQPKSDAPKPGFSFEENGGAGVATSVSTKIKTLDDLLDYAKVDRAIWEVERYIVNKWDMGYKGPDKQPGSHPLYQVKAWLRRRVIVERTREIIKDMLAEFGRKCPKLPSMCLGNRSADSLLLEVSIFDLHLGKLCWAPEVGRNYDQKISQSAFTESLESLLKRVKGFPIERILFPVGNDFFNVDNAAKLTNAGTPQDEDARWQKSFITGRKLMVEAIHRLRTIAPVDVVMVAGNHDTERIFYLGDVLSGWFSKTAGVTVNNEPSLRKYYQFGKCMIGFTHGKEEPHKNLPLIMATEQAHMFAATDFREMHLGHWHHKKEIHFQPVEEYNGIRVRIIPSLCPSDAWHKMKGYNGLRAAEAFLWDKKHGCVGSFSFSP